LAQEDLKQGTSDATRGLFDVRAVRDERKSAQWQAADKSLKVSTLVLVKSIRVASDHASPEAERLLY